MAAPPPPAALAALIPMLQAAGLVTQLDVMNATAPLATQANVNAQFAAMQANFNAQFAAMQANVNAQFAALQAQLALIGIPAISGAVSAIVKISPLRAL